MIRMWRLLLALVVCALMQSAYGLDEAGEGESDRRRDKDPRIAFKLTPTWYSTTHEHAAVDLNLRGNKDEQTAWVGIYRRGEEFQQGRLGYEHTVQTAMGKVTGSAQYATRGFAGGSVQGEFGERMFGILGFGRTNLKPYFNLNFDPNDAITVGGGIRLAKETVVTLFHVRDDRSSLGQKITHFVIRTRPDAKSRITFDLFQKSGWNADGDTLQPVRGTGAGVTVDYDRYFARVVWDPKVNFSNNDMLRMAAGVRF
ncbi:MAG: hypothetical protein EXR29_14250 [Betaproteobacteria bacterium]|nr:hypothetical protein [Betaproteobacteria bacterium]